MIFPPENVRNDDISVLWCCARKMRDWGYGVLSSPMKKVYTVFLISARNSYLFVVLWVLLPFNSQKPLNMSHIDRLQLSILSIVEVSIGTIGEVLLQKTGRILHIHLKASYPVLLSHSQKKHTDP